MLFQRPIKNTAVSSYPEKEEADMFSIICSILFLMVFFKLLTIAFKVSWGILKVAMYLIVFPVVVVALIFGGLAVIALPIILIAGATGMATA